MKNSSVELWNHSSVTQNQKPEDRRFGSFTSESYFPEATYHEASESSQPFQEEMTI